MRQQSINTINHRDKRASSHHPNSAQRGAKIMQKRKAKQPSRQKPSLKKRVKELEAVRDDLIQRAFNQAADFEALHRDFAALRERLAPLLGQDLA